MSNVLKICFIYLKITYVSRNKKKYGRREERPIILKQMAVGRAKRRIVLIDRFCSRH